MRNNDNTIVFRVRRENKVDLCTHCSMLVYAILFLMSMFVFFYPESFIGWHLGDVDVVSSHAIGGDDSSVDVPIDDVALNETLAVEQAATKHKNKKHNIIDHPKDDDEEEKVSFDRHMDSIYVRAKHNSIGKSSIHLNARLLSFQMICYSLCGIVIHSVQKPHAVAKYMRLHLLFHAMLIAQMFIAFVELYRWRALHGVFECFFVFFFVWGLQSLCLISIYK